jgi:dethiobiotin synthetase
VGKGLFVTGTDTGVGKTVVAAAIAAALLGRGIDVGVMKPLESGCSREAGRLIPSDATMLKQAAQCQDDIEVINPYRLEYPLAPGMAAELEGVEISIKAIKERYNSLAASHDLLLVEGAGGLLVPVKEDHLMADLAKALGLPLLVVARANLGTINHTLLTLHYAAHEGVPVTGVVMNCPSARQGLAESLNPAAIRKWSREPFLGVMPFLPDLKAETLRAAAEAHLDLRPVEALMG